LELVSVLVIIGIMATMALSVSRRASDSTMIKRSIADLLQLQTRIDEFSMTMDRLPTSLSELSGGVMQDPWGNAYEYTPFSTAGMGQARRDRFLVPINTLYDLYSRGRDGLTARDLTDPSSLDDVVRANDGAFMGLAIAY
jgi:general secretion pathway protein G